MALISEFSSGGFLLFFLDKEGQPSEEMLFDSPACGIAIHSHAKKWCEALDALNTEVTVNKILSKKPRRKE